MDAIIELYREHLDKTLIRENLKLSPQELIEQLDELSALYQELRQAGRKVA